MTPSTTPRVNARTRSPWSEQEDSIIRSYYPTEGAKRCRDALPSRTISSIRQRARKLEIEHATSGQSRKVVDEQRIVDLYNEYGTIGAVCDRMDDVGEWVVHRVLVERGIEIRVPYALDRIRQQITDDYHEAKLTVPEIAAKYGTTVSTLRKAISRWKIRDVDRQQRLISNGVHRANRVAMYDCWVASYGVEEADRRWDKWIAKQRVASSGERNPMFGKPAPQGSGNGWKGWYKQHHFRSLRELAYMLSLDDQGIPWISAESIRIPYERGRRRTYAPDFLVNGTMLVEVKPIKLQPTRSVQEKKAVAELFCAERGWTYCLIDPMIDTERLRRANDAGEILWERDYAVRFAAYQTTTLALPEAA